MTEAPKSINMDPELASAIVAAQTAIESLRRDGTGDKGSYTTADAIAEEARRALTKHGAAWVRYDVDLIEPGLKVGDIGKQEYVGDLREGWMIVHKNGSAITGSSRMPVIVSRGRPHDKAVGASLTYDVGGALRGALCMDRESKDGIDRRRDDDDQDNTDAGRPDAGRTDALRILDAAVGAYAEILGKGKGAVFNVAVATAKLEAVEPGDLSTSDAIGLGRLILERIRATVHEAYKALCELDPEDYSPDAWAPEWANMIGVDAWPENPTPEQYAAVHARMAAITILITGDTTP